MNRSLCLMRHIWKQSWFELAITAFQMSVTKSAELTRHSRSSRLDGWSVWWPRMFMVCPLRRRPVDTVTLPMCHVGCRSWRGMIAGVWGLRWHAASRWLRRTLWKTRCWTTVLTTHVRCHTQQVNSPTNNYFRCSTSWKNGTSIDIHHTQPDTNVYTFFSYAEI